MEAEAEWTGKRCPRCNCYLLAYEEYLYCSLTTCDYGLENDVTFNSFPHEVDKKGELIKDSDS